jgi:hypothetical protein
MRFTRSRWGRILGFAVLLAWPVLLPHPVNAVAACIWYPVLGLSGMAYFLSKVQDDTADRPEPVPPATPAPEPARAPFVTAAGDSYRAN